MAEFPTVDLFSEIDELACLADGKGVENNFSFLLDEDLDVSSRDLPSSGFIMGDDSMLAVDLSNNLLVDDPLLTMFNPNELLNLQPASPGFNPETLIPVSLPADSSTPDIQPPSDEEVDYEEPQYPEEDTPKNSTANPTSIKNSKPVCIIVNTQRKSAKKMVAPALLPKPANNLVKIPKAEHTSTTVRLRRIRAGEKVAPISTSSSKISGIGRFEVEDHDVTSSPEASRLELRRESSSSSSSSPSSTNGENNRDLPFWSLRSRNLSGSSASSAAAQPSASRVKRKAYELDPLADPQMERCRRNAVNAKKNREMKKAHMAELEKIVQDVSWERDQLAGENESLREANVKLEQQVKHLNNILKNQSQLSAVITKLSPSSVILGDLSRSGNEDEIISSGMCLHVDGQEATIEYCSYCAKKAGKKLLL